MIAITPSWNFTGVQIYKLVLPLLCLYSPEYDHANYAMCTTHSVSPSYAMCNQNNIIINIKHLYIVQNIY